MCSIGAIHHPPIEVSVFLHFMIKEEKPAETPEENNNIEQENTNKEKEIL